MCSPLTTWALLAGIDHHLIDEVSELSRTMINGSEQSYRDSDNRLTGELSGLNQKELNDLVQGLNSKEHFYNNEPFVSEVRDDKSGDIVALRFSNWSSLPSHEEVIVMPPSNVYVVSMHEKE